METETAGVRHVVVAVVLLSPRKLLVSPLMLSLFSPSFSWAAVSLSSVGFSLPFHPLFKSKGGREL